MIEFWNGLCFEFVYTILRILIEIWRSFNIIDTAARANRVSARIFFQMSFLWISRLLLLLWLSYYNILFLFLLSLCFHKLLITCLYRIFILIQFNTLSLLCSVVLYKGNYQLTIRNIQVILTAQTNFLPFVFDAKMCLWNAN